MEHEHSPDAIRRRLETGPTHALSTFTAFLVWGLVPLLPYLIGTTRSFSISLALTGVVFFGIGSIKSRWSTSSRWYSGFITLLVGGMAASLAYAVGVILNRL